MPSTGHHIAQRLLRNRAPFICGLALLCLGQASARRIEHWVVRGDTAYNIAKRYGLSLDALLDQANLRAGGLKLGQRLILEVPDGAAATPVASSSAPVALAAGVGAVQGKPPAPAVALGPGVALPRPGALPVAAAPAAVDAAPGALPPAITPPLAALPAPTEPLAAARQGVEAGTALAVGPDPLGGPVLMVPVPIDPGLVTGAPTYTVVAGDTAYSVARRFGLSVAALLQHNGLSTPDLRAGQVLLVGSGGASAAPGAPPDATSLRGRALALLGTPYVYGGSSPAGTDCSGFVLQVYTPLGVALPRRSAEQAGAGVPVALTDLREGDLLFFDTAGRGEVTHVGIYLDGGTFIDANSYLGRVALDQLTDPYFAGRFLGARRVLDPVAAQPDPDRISGTSVSSGSR